MAEEKKDKKSSDKSSQEFVTRDMLIGEVVQKYPKAAFVMMQYGLHCVGCHVSAFETIEQGCLGHGMPEDVLEELIEDLNAFIADEQEAQKEENAGSAGKAHPSAADKAAPTQSQAQGESEGKEKKESTEKEGSEGKKE